MARSKIPPSAANMWAPDDGCGGWGDMVAQFEKPAVYPHAQAGLTAHALAQMSIREGMNGSTFALPTSHEGVVVDDEMREAVQLYVDDVLTEYRARDAENCFVGIERRVVAASIHSESKGDVDAVLFDEPARHLILWDFKYGHGVVEAFENWQMLNYVAAVFDLIQIPLWDDATVSISLRIVQPRAYHGDSPIQEWRTTHAELIPYFETMRRNAERALSGTAQVRSGPHCRYCEARHACPAALKAGASLYESVATSSPLQDDAPQLGARYSLVRRALAHLTSLETGLSEELQARLRKGERVPGWVLSSTAGALKWNCTVDEVIAMGELFDVPLAKPDTLTPTQALKKGLDEDTVALYAQRTGGKLKLTETTNRQTDEAFKQ